MENCVHWRPSWRCRKASGSDARATFGRVRPRFWSQVRLVTIASRVLTFGEKFQTFSMPNKIKNTSRKGEETLRHGSRIVTQRHRSQSHEMRLTGSMRNDFGSLRLPSVSMHAANIRVQIFPRFFYLSLRAVLMQITETIYRL